MKTILLMDIVIVFVGIYLAVSAAKMKKSGQISDLVVPKEEIKKCKDPEAYIRGITPWLYGFAAVSYTHLLFGVAVIYLVLVMILTAGVHKQETRLRTHER